MTACLEATYAATVGYPETPLTLATLTIAPPSRIRGRAYFMPRNVPRALTAMTRSNSVSSKSGSGAAGPARPPAWTIASIALGASVAACT